MFDVAAESYGRFMGRYSEPLAEQFVSWVGALAGQSALDVGCGPGALTERLVERLGVTSVSAVDPSGSFVAALRLRLPGIDVREGAAENLPHASHQFDLCCAQLVVHFMTDPVRGLSEMARVAKQRGVVAASTWDHPGNSGPLSVFWTAVKQLDPEAQDESALPGTRKGHLEELFEQAGLVDIESTRLTVTVSYSSFDEWWQPYTLGVGTAGAHVARLTEAERTTLQDECRRILPSAPFDLTAAAWCVKARE